MFSVPDNRIEGESMDKGLLILGFVAQGLFFGRFLVQWIASERQGRSVVPIAFWFLSVAGGGLLFVYALLRKDPVFAVGQGGGLFIYLRNIYLIYKKRPQNAEEEAKIASSL